MSDDVNYINLERLRTFLQEVKRLIPTNYATKTELEAKANDSDVVHKSGDETISGVKNFANNIYTLGSQFVMQSSNTERTVLPTSTVYTNITFSDKTGSGVVSRLGAVETSVQTNGDIRLYLRAYDFSSKTSTNSSAVLERKYDGTSNFYSYINNDINLGTKTNKWKTLNGINPGALSLPNLNMAIDISGSLDTSQSSKNTYIPPSDGYISIIGRGASTSGIVIKTGSLFANMGYNIVDFDSNDRVSFCMCPVFKDQAVTIWLKSVTSLDSAKFYPCQGNV